MLNMNVEPLRHEARVNITWRGQNGDLRDPVSYDATDADILAWVAEAVRSGSVAGVNTDRFVDLREHVVDRFPSTAQTPHNRIFVRPKTPFG